MTQEIKAGKKWVENSSGIIIELILVNANASEHNQINYEIITNTVVGNTFQSGMSIHTLLENFTLIPETKDEMIKKVEELLNIKGSSKGEEFEFGIVAVSGRHNQGTIRNIELELIKQLTPYLEKLGEILKKENK